MYRISSLLLILVVAGSVFAVERATPPTAPNAYVNDRTSPSNPEGKGVAVVASRQTTVYYDPATFVPLLTPGYYFDDFSYLEWETINGEPFHQFGPVNGYSYTVAVPSNGIFSIPGAVSTWSAFDPISITFDGLPVFAVGGDFYGTDLDGYPIPASITVTLNDGTTVELDQPAVFVGFSSGTAITQLTITTVDVGIDVWITFDNFYVGRFGPVTASASTWSSVKALYE